MVERAATGMNVLVINCGSSSIKYGVYKMPSRQLAGKGIVDRIGQKPSWLKYEHGDKKETREVEIEDHRRAVHLILDSILDEKGGLIAGDETIGAVGHRVVHGGTIESEAAFIDDEIMGVIQKFAPMAPLHNPPDLMAMQAVTERMSDVPQVACYDTAFHHTIPEAAYLYGLPLRFYEEYGVRRYGFHGISHHYVTARAAEILARPVVEMNAITCHLGNGCSITAIHHGRSVDTSMGLTPLEGLLMGTRTGDIDPGALFHLIDKGVEVEDLRTIVNNESGLLGLSGVSRDMRDILRAASDGDERAAMALEVFCYRLRKYIGAYAAVVGELQALVFTGGIGENAPEVRWKTCADMRHLGIEIDAGRNEAAVGREEDISAGESRAKVLVIPTNEELAIAANAYRLLTSRSGVTAARP